MKRRGLSDAANRFWLAFEDLLRGNLDNRGNLANNIKIDKNIIKSSAISKLLPAKSIYLTVCDHLRIVFAAENCRKEHWTGLKNPDNADCDGSGCSGVFEWDHDGSAYTHDFAAIVRGTSDADTRLCVKNSGSRISFRADRCHEKKRVICRAGESSPHMYKLRFLA